MPGVVPQVPRRMGIGRGVRTSCMNDVPQNQATPGVGLQREKLNEPENDAENHSKSQNISGSSESVYFVSKSPSQVGEKLIEILVDRQENFNAAAMNDTVPVECDTSAFYDSFGGGDAGHFRSPIQHKTESVVKVKDMENESFEKLEVEKTLLRIPSSRVSTQDARDRRKAAFARFLRPALLQAQANKTNGIAVEQTRALEEQDPVSNGPLTPPPAQIPRAAAKTEGENLTRTTVSSELSNGHVGDGSQGGDTVHGKPDSAMKIRVLASMKALDEKTVERGVSIPAPMISNLPVRSRMSAQEVTSVKNPVTVKPMVNIRKAPSDAGSVRSMSMSRTHHPKSKVAVAGPGQECIKKKRSYPVCEWRSFLIKNFALHEEDSFTVWITESDIGQELEEQFDLIDNETLEPLASHMLGGTALTKRNEKFLRVMITDLRYNDATVQDVDSGDKFDVTVAELYPLSQALKSIPPLALKVAVTSDRITNAKRFETALQLAKEHRTVTDGCAVTWDFVPRFVFRLPGCRALAVTDEPISAQWTQNSAFTFATKQHLYRDVPGILLPASGTFLRKCIVTHVEGPAIYITWEDLHNFVLEPALEDLPLRYEIGEMCMVLSETDPSIQMRCCIECLQEDVAWVRWIDCGVMLQVEKQSLCPLPSYLIYPPGTVKATLASFTADDLDSASDDLSQVLLTLDNLQIFFLDSKAVPGVLIFTENFIEVKPDKMDELKTLCATGTIDVHGEPPGAEEPEEAPDQPKDATVVGVAAFSQVWVVPKEQMGDLEDMEVRLTQSKPPDLVDCEPDTPCAVMLENLLRRGLVRLRIGKRFLVRLVDRASEISAARVFEMPDEFRSLPSPCHCIALCPEQVRDAHFGRFITAMKRNPDVTLTPVSAALGGNSTSSLLNGSETPSSEVSDTTSSRKYFLTTPEGEDIMTAYNIRDTP